MPTESVEVAEPFGFCLGGFDATLGPVSAEVAGPSGFTRAETIPLKPDGTGSWSYTPIPGDPLGSYTYSLSQDDLAPIAGEFTVSAATEPRIVPTVASGLAGTTFAFELAGLSGPVSVYLYRSDGSRWVYVSTLPSLSPDSDGQATLDIASGPGDPPGEYGIRTDPDAMCSDGLVACPFQIAS